MLSILKMDLRRMAKNKSLYLAILIFLLFSGYCIYTQAKWQVINKYPFPETLHLDAGLYSIVDYYLNDSLQLMYIFLFKNGLIIFGIYIVSSIASDYQSGFIKNSYMMCNHPSMILWSKLCISIIVSVMIVVLSFLLVSVFGFLFISDFAIGNGKEILIFAGNAVLLYTSFFSGISFLYRFLKNKIPSILLCVFFPLGLTMIALQPMLGEFTKYTLSSAFLNFPLHDHDGMIQTAAICLMFTLIYHGLSMILFKKRDI